jgi:hypothetical protein
MSRQGNLTMALLEVNMFSALHQPSASQMWKSAEWRPNKNVLHSGIWLSMALLMLGILSQALEAMEVRIDPSEIVTLLPKDAIPAIHDPKPLLVPAREVKGVRDTDQVLGVAIGGESRAYPIPFLSWHEIVNDTVGGVPIAVTW